MATFTVTTAADIVNAADGVLSLREAVSQANITVAADTIVFSGAVESQTLVLTGGPISINNDTTIDGDQNNDGIQAIVSGGNETGILSAIGDSTSLSLVDIQLRDGSVDYEVNNNGGALSFNGESLNIINSSFFYNESSTQVGSYRNSGAIYFAGEVLYVRSSTFAYNVGFIGGAIGTSSAGNARVTILDSNFAYNGGGEGGAINIVGDLVLEDSTLSGNAAFGYNGGFGGGLSLSGSGMISRT